MFDFSHHMSRLIRDIVHHTPELHYVDCDRLVVAASQQRKFGSTGLYAKVVPLRFTNGSFTSTEHGGRWRVPPFTHAGREILYIISFCLPRFLNISYHAKGDTILHELLHISPAFDGDLRRFPGAYYQHGPSAAAYDAHAAALFMQYQRRATAPHLLRFLRSRFHHLEDRYGSVTALRVTTPSPRPVEADDGPLVPAPLRVRSRAILSARTQRLRQSA